MSSWVTHQRISDRVLSELTWLCRREFSVGNIAPDCNLPNEDFTALFPPREVTHYMAGKRKTASDCERFYNEVIKKKSFGSKQEESFFLGYYSHLITDAEIQRYTRDEDRVREAIKRIKSIPILKERFGELPENWDSVKQVIGKPNLLKDYAWIDFEYLEEHPESGFLTEVLPLREFPDYMEILPKGAIVKKIDIMGHLPKKEKSEFPFIAFSKEEYLSFVSQATTLVLTAIKKHLERTN